MTETSASLEAASHCTPNEAFLRAPAQAQRRWMVAAMEEPDDLARTLKKDGLVTLVTEAADAPPPEGDAAAPAIAA